MARSNIFSGTTLSKRYHGSRASIHGDIHEAVQSKRWEKASFVPTNELSLAYLEFLGNQYALSDFWLAYVQQRLCWARGMKGVFFLQTSNRNYQEAKVKFEMNQEIITCPMHRYVPFTCTKTSVCIGYGEVESNQLIACEDSLWCMWSML